jgi:hypothetical protein
MEGREEAGQPPVGNGGSSPRRALREIREQQSRGDVELNCERSGRNPLQEKLLSVTTVAVRTKTDTGRQGEYPKALERIHVKELGKLCP